MPYFQPSAIKCLPDEIFKVGSVFKEKWELDPILDHTRKQDTPCILGACKRLLLIGPEI
jgi:hypothetical protein